MLKLVFAAVLVALVLDSALAKGLPSYLKICKRNDPNINQCVMENVEILRPRLKDGIPELFIPPLNPLVIAEATLNSGDNFKATFSNIEMYKAHEFILKDFKVDLDNNLVSLDVVFPKLRIISVYNINGRVLVLNLNGQGAADGNYTNVEATLSLKGISFQKNNKEYIRWEKEKIDINIEKINLFFDKIFGDNEELNDQTNKVINQNIDAIVEDLQPVIQQIVSDFVFNLVNRLFARYSITDLFPLS